MGMMAFLRAKAKNRPPSPSVTWRIDSADDDDLNISEVKVRNAYLDLADRLFNSITVHGVYFLGESRTIVGKVLWLLIVMMGISGAVTVIYDSYENWKAHPVLTTVKQIPIEKVPFPAITICPLDGTYFGYLENHLNIYFEELQDRLDTANVMVDIVQLLRKDIPFNKDQDKCLEEICLDKTLDNTNCSGAKDFELFMESLSSDAPYEKVILDKIKQFIRDILPSLINNFESWNLNNSTVLDKKQPSCLDMSHDFQLFQKLDSLFPNPVDAATIKFGSLLNFLYTHIHEEDYKEKSLKKFLNHLDFAWSLSVGHNAFDRLSLPSLVHYLTDRAAEEPETEADKEKHDNFQKEPILDDIDETFSMYDYTPEADFLESEFAVSDTLTRRKRGGSGSKKKSKKVDLSGIEFSEKLLRVVKQSHHTPHTFDYFDDVIPHIQRVAAATVPFCWYFTANNTNSGLPFGPYGESYCDEFQTTFNEYGLCYTYNNFDLKTNGLNLEGERCGTVRKSEGCGKRKGLRLILDSQEVLRGSLTSTHHSEGFFVFVTPQGATSSSVHFHIHPEYEGEHFFYIHNLQKTTSEPAFVDWNKDEKLCYFPDDKNLTFFQTRYTQNNCLLECRLAKISQICGCSPWYLNQDQLPVCGKGGNKCFFEQSEDYHDEAKDIVQCDCRGDCEGNNFFVTSSFLERKYTNSQAYYDEIRGTGLLYKYLLDPENFFTDPVTTNLTRLLYDASKADLAKRRFHNDISILNFFFDTPMTNELKREMRVTILDQISAIGGTLGLFTGTSLITFVEIGYWCGRFFLTFFRSKVLGITDTEDLTGGPNNLVKPPARVASAAGKSKNESLIIQRLQLYTPTVYNQRNNYVQEFRE